MNRKHPALLPTFVALFACGALAVAACGGSSTANGGTPGVTPDDEGGVPGTDEGGTTTSGGPTNNPDGGPPLPLGPDNVQIVVEPTDKAQALLDAITAAKTSVHLTMYLLNDKRFISALISLHQAGRDVKVILNQTFTAGAGTNAAVFSQLKTAGVAVVYAPATFTLTHEKCAIIDGTTAWIMTMNLETTSSTNREFLAIDTTPADVKEAEAIFAADYANTAYVPSGNLLVAPVNARDRLLALIAGAKKTVDLEGEELSDYKIVNALAAAQKAGVTVHVVLSNDPTPAASQTSAVAQLKAASVKVVQVNSPYIHAKAIVADGVAAYVGSENFTTGSLQYNRELGLITTNAASAAQVDKIIAQDFAAGTAL